MGAMDLFKPNLRQVAAKLLLGKAFEIDASGSAIVFKDTDGNPVPIQVADGSNLSDVATVKQLREGVTWRVTGQIDGSAPPDASANDGAIFIVTTAGGDYALREVYVARGGSWTQLTVDDGQAITVADDLTGGTNEYAGGHLYVYDADTDTWMDNGATTSLAGVARLNVGEVAHDASSPAEVFAGTGTSGPERMYEVRIRVTETFDDSGAQLDGLTGYMGSDVLPPPPTSRRSTSRSSAITSSRWRQCRSATRSSSRSPRPARRRGTSRCSSTGTRNRHRAGQPRSGFAGAGRATARRPHDQREASP